MVPSRWSARPTQLSRGGWWVLQHRNGRCQCLTQRLTGRFAGLASLTSQVPAPIGWTVQASIFVGKLHSRAISCRLQTTFYGLQFHPSSWSAAVAPQTRLQCPGALGQVWRLVVVYDERPSL